MRILAISPHPDDVEIAMGGTIAKYVSSGHRVTIIIVHNPKGEKDRIAESKRAAAILGAELRFLNFNENQMCFNRNNVEVFDKLLCDYQPDSVFTSWLYDSHQDHYITSQCVIAATRKNHSAVYMYHQQIPSGITNNSFRSQAFVDISDCIDLKIEAIRAHDSQFQKYGQEWIEGIKGEGRYWGFRVNCMYAEAFEVVKEKLSI